MPGSMLHHLVILKLAEAPQSGYGLCSSIEQSIGRRPSYGSIYPYLEKLSTEGMVTVKQQGRKKIYALTTKGENLAKEMEEKREDILKKMEPNMLALAHLMGIDANPFKTIVERLRRGEAPLGGVSGNMFLFRNKIFEMATDGTLPQHEKEINAMLKENLKRLEKMK